MNLVISTFPSETSANVGDKLITSSFLELAQSIGVISDYEITFRGTPLLDSDITKYGGQPIFMPGFSISTDAYPKLYPLRSLLKEIPLGLIPFGCTWHHEMGYQENAEVAPYAKQMFNLLMMIADRTGPIAVRDHMAHGILFRHGIPAIMVGDCGWYHLPSKGKPMRRPKRIGKIAITTPHNMALMDQAGTLVEMMCGQFPDAEIALCLHSKRTSGLEQLINCATEKGLDVIDAADDISIFDRYEEYDVHVGYRLHGHIGFLRRRIPSVLLMEDARSRGFSLSMPIGCFSARKASIGPHILSRVPLAIARENVLPDARAVPRVREFLVQEIESRFLRYCGISQYLDEMLTSVVIPQLLQKVKLATQAIKAPLI